MVSFFSFFKWKSTSAPTPALNTDTEQDKNGQGQGQRDSSEAYASAAPNNTSVDEDNGGVNRGSTGAHRARPGRFLSLRRRSSKPYDQHSTSASLRRSGSTDSRRRKNQQFSDLISLYTPLKLDLPIDIDGAGSDPLGLYGVGRLVNLTIKEKGILNQIRLTTVEVQKGWQLFGSALKSFGMDKSGLMLPLRTSTSIFTTAQTQSHILALYTLTIRPSLISSFPSITSHYPPTDDYNVWPDRLLAALRDVQSPHDIAELLKWTLRRFTPVQGQGIVTKEQYVKFVQAEHALSYPLNAFDTYLETNLESRAYLDQVFEVLAGIATHAEENSMSAGRLAYLLGLWILSDMTIPKEKAGWKILYKIWKEKGERTEHLIYAWIRYQSTKQQIPTRLLELVDQYPFGESSASSEHLPLPPPSSFPRQTLHVTLSSNSPLDGLFPSVEDVVKATIASSPNVSIPTPLWSSLSRNGDTPAELSDILSEESCEFLRSVAAVTARTPPSSPIPRDFVTPAANEGTAMYRPFSTMSSESTSPRIHARQLSQSHTVPSTTEKTHLALPTPNDDTVTQTKDDSPKSIRKQASTSAIPRVTGDSTLWDSFRQSGFSDSPRTIGDLALALTPRSETFSPMTPKSPTTPISPHTSNLKRGNSTSRPTTKRKTTFQDQLEITPVFNVVKEEVIEIDDIFIAFVEDGQLDSSVTSDWPPFGLVQLHKPLAQSSTEGKPIEWLLITVEYRPPTTVSNTSEPEILARAASPSAASTTSRMSTTRGFKDFANSFKRSASFPSRPSTAPSGLRRSFFRASGRNLAKQAALEPLSEDTLNRELRAPPSAQSLAPTEYTIGEMGEIIKIPSMTENANVKVNDEIDPSDQTTSHDWKYVAEGGAHVVFAYRGTLPLYIGKVLRIRKSEPTTPNTDADTDQTELQREWRFNLLPKLLPEELLVKADEVVLEEKWLKNLFALADRSRPESRKNGVLAESISGAGRGLLMEDTTAATVVAGKDSVVLSVEIKPKWGFLPEAKWLQPPESIDIKTHNCRFCMHRHLKETAATEYCPLDLYSGNEERILKALYGLWGSWRDTEGKGNNWRVFVDGIRTSPAQAQAIPTCNENLATGTVDYFLPVLQQSNVLERLATLQSSLDPTDISDLATRFPSYSPGASLFDTSLLPTPSLVELKEFIDLYLSHPSAGKHEEGWNLRQRLIAYSLSAIFKDCSIFIKCPLTRSSPEDSWKLDLERSEVKVIDLDIKPIQNMKQWYDLDTKIWQHYLNTEPDTKGCVQEDSSEIETPKKRKESPSLLNLEDEQDSASTRALFVPTPAPSTTVTVSEMELDRMSFLDALAISPTKPIHNHDQSVNSEELLHDDQAQNLSVQDSTDDRRERSLAPSPSPSLAPVQLHDMELPTVSDTVDAKVSEPSIIDKDIQENIAPVEESQSGVLATVSAAAIGVIGGIATAVGLAETTEDISKKEEDVVEKEEVSHPAPLEADVDALTTLEAEDDEPVSEAHTNGASQAEEVEPIPFTSLSAQKDVKHQKAHTSVHKDEIVPVVAVRSDVLADSDPATITGPEAESEVESIPFETAEEDKVEPIAAATSTLDILRNAESGSSVHEESVAPDDESETAISTRFQCEDDTSSTLAVPPDSATEEDNAKPTASESETVAITVASKGAIDQSLSYNLEDILPSGNREKARAKVAVPIAAAATASDILQHAELPEIVDEKENSRQAEPSTKATEDYEVEETTPEGHDGQQGETRTVGEVDNIKPSGQIVPVEEAIIPTGDNEPEPEAIQRQDGSSLEQVVTPNSPIQQMAKKDDIAIPAPAPVGEEGNPDVGQSEEGTEQPDPAHDISASPETETNNENSLAHSIIEPLSSTESTIEDGGAVAHVAGPQSEDIEPLEHELAISSITKDSLIPVESDKPHVSVVPEVENPSVSPAGLESEYSVDETDGEEEIPVTNGEAEGLSTVDIPAAVAERCSEVQDDSLVPDVAEKQPTPVNRIIGQDDIPELGAPISESTEEVAAEQDQPIRTLAEPEVEEDVAAGTLDEAQSSAAIVKTSALDENKDPHEGIDLTQAQVGLPESNDGESFIRANDHEEEQEQITPHGFDIAEQSVDPQVESGTEEPIKTDPANIHLPAETNILELEQESPAEKETP